MIGLPTAFVHNIYLKCKWQNEFDIQLETNGCSCLLFNRIESQAWLINSSINHFAWSWIHSKVNDNHNITTQKWRRKNFTTPQGFEPWPPGTESQCASYEQLCPPWFSYKTALAVQVIVTIIPSAMMWWLSTEQ